MLRGKKAMAGVHANNARTNNSRAEIFIQNMNIYMYTHINFQEYSYLDIEDTYASDHKKTIFPLFFGVFSTFRTAIKITQKWRTTSHQIWCYTSGNTFISRAHLHTYLIKHATTLQVI